MRKQSSGDTLLQPPVARKRRDTGTRLSRTTCFPICATPRAYEDEAFDGINNNGENPVCRSRKRLCGMRRLVSYATPSR